MSRSQKEQLVSGKEWLLLSSSMDTTVAPYKSVHTKHTVPQDRMCFIWLLHHGKGKRKDQKREGIAI